MLRKELQEELEEVRKWTAASYETKKKEAAEAAEKRILNWYDDISRELAYLASLRDNLAQVVREKVELSIENQELLQRLEHATRTRKEDEDD